jgi:hypothetical protein
MVPLLVEYLFQATGIILQVHPDQMAQSVETYTTVGYTEPVVPEQTIQMVVVAQ